MRRYTDRLGRRWDIVIGRESFGALLALFVPVAGNREGPRETPLESESRLGADSELDTMESADLDALFERSKPKETA